jgi:hypothetical protein
MTESSVGKSEYVYRGWKIRITGTAAVTFSARVEVWKPVAGRRMRLDQGPLHSPEDAE